MVRQVCQNSSLKCDTAWAVAVIFHICLVVALFVAISDIVHFLETLVYHQSSAVGDLKYWMSVQCFVQNSMILIA